MPSESIAVIYLVIGVGVSVVVYLSDGVQSGVERAFGVVVALIFWPLYVPILLARSENSQQERTARVPTVLKDEMTAAIDQVDGELTAALGSLDGWAEDVLAREKDRFRELRAAWSVQAERIREMDRLLAQPETVEAVAHEPDVAPYSLAPDPSVLSERVRHSRQARRQNFQRLRQVRRRAYDDLMATLAWVRELVSMIHLAKFTGAPASRAEELVAQIAAAVEGISETTWREDENGNPAPRFLPPEVHVVSSRPIPSVESPAPALAPGGLPPLPGEASTAPSRFDRPGGAT